MKKGINEVTINEIRKAVYGDNYVWVSTDEVLGICDTNADIKLITTISFVADYDIYVQWYPRVGADPIVNAAMQGFISGIIKVWLPNYHVAGYCYEEGNCYIRFESNFKQKEN